MKSSQGISPGFYTYRRNTGTAHVSTLEPHFTSGGKPNLRGCHAEALSFQASLGRRETAGRRALHARKRSRVARAYPCHLPRTPLRRKMTLTGQSRLFVIWSFEVQCEQELPRPSLASALSRISLRRLRQCHRFPLPPPHLHRTLCSSAVSFAAGALRRVF